MISREKTHREVILQYLTAITPRKATRREIMQETGLPSDQVLNGLLDLQRAGRVQSCMDPPDTPRLFWVELSARSIPQSKWHRRYGVAPDFETLALTRLCQYMGCHLARRSVPGQDRAFIGSEDGMILGDIIDVTDADSLAAVEACRRLLASLDVALPLLITGGDFDILWAWFHDHAATLDVPFFFITPEGEIIELAAEMVEGVR